MKRLLWMLPLLAIALGAVTSFWFTRSTNELLDNLGRTDSPALGAVQSLAFGLTAVADGYKSAAAAADQAALDGVAQKVALLREEFKRYAAVPGRAEDAARLSAAFETYQQAASKVADILIKGKGGDVGEAAQAMQAAQKAA